MSRIMATIVTVMLAVIVPFGCRTARRLELTESGAPAFERFEAEYEIPFADSHLQRSFADNSKDAETVSAGSTVQPVSATSDAASNSGKGKDSEKGRRRTRLKIECPASPNKPDEARLILEIPSSLSGSLSTESCETRQLIVPRKQVELLILDLARAEFFDSPDPPGARSPLSVTIDGARVTRNWRADDRLLDFAHRACHLGRVTED